MELTRFGWLLERLRYYAKGERIPFVLISIGDEYLGCEEVCDG